MSTRANVLVTFGKTEIYLYRHMDGYVAGCGAAIADELGRAKGPTDFVRRMLALRYEKRSFDKVRKPIYEVTCEFHGDIEYAYHVRFDLNRPYNKETVSVGFRHFDFGPDRERQLATLDPKGFIMDTAAAFCAFAKAEERDMAARLSARGLK